MDKRLVKISKYLAKVLRHNPERIGLVLDAHGWAKVDDIIRLSNNMMTRSQIEEVVAQNDKNDMRCPKMDSSYEQIRDIQFR